VTGAGGRSESIAFSAPFVAENTADVAPEMVGSKVGMQLPDRSMSDASFLAVSLAAFSAINVAKDGVEEWLKSSEDVRHTISNVQAAATSSGSYITLYRHPLNVCNDRFSSSEDEIKSRRLMR